MKRFFRHLILALLPPNLRKKWRFRFAPEEYVIIPKSEFLYAEDNVYTSNSPTFLEDENFVRAYRLGEQTGSWGTSVVRWRAYVACWAGRQAAKLPGDFVECGVNRGGLSRAIIDYTQFQNLDKQFYLIDNFTGLVPEYVSEAERSKGLLENYAYYNNNSSEEVAKIFKAFANVKIIQGNVPDVLPAVPSRAVAYLSLDMNCTMPEISAAEFFWDQMVPGGIILLDDYTQTMHSEQQKAFDAFADKRGLSILALPTGQGILFKPAAMG